ncbi:hypothetical protein JRQ81_016096 [Phrynocephalus forsythii]|uniref:FAM194 C-terminal domain-containing protein n=1 Tax=Phrynocephalus forsythii TaxID=171643 RepID=A0A9Q0XXT8_9SAUR|nr:hypothetical protein JRQ81_016096 [Phrynocephalus forsythii]
MMYHQKGGMVTTKDGEILRKWKWPGAGKLDDPVIAQVNKYITVRIAGRFAVSLIYRWQHESIHLSLSVGGVAVPQLESLSSLHEVQNLAHFSPILMQPLIHLANSLACIGARQVGCTRYATLFSLAESLCDCRPSSGTGHGPEISLLHIHKGSTFPPRGGQECKISPASAFLRKNKSCEAAVSRNLPPFRSAVPPEPSRSPYLLTGDLKTKQVAPDLVGLSKENIPRLPKARSSPTACFSVHTACPVILQRAMLGEESRICRCSNRQIPSVTDLEYDHVLNNQASSPEQITVVCVTASVGAAKCDPRTEEHLEWLYERKNKDRSMPFTQGHLDSFCLLKYDINSADEFTGRCGSLLVKRHNIAPGMVLVGYTYPSCHSVIQGTPAAEREMIDTKEHAGV